MTADIQTPEAAARSAPRAAPTRPRRSRFLWGMFLIVVILPTAATLFYAITTRTPFYLSQVQFAVEDRSQSDVSGASSVMASIGIMGGEPNSMYSLRRFIRSRDALAELEASIGFRRHYGPDKGDWLTSLSPDASVDTVLDYYNLVVTPQISTTESILTLEIWAYDPAIAQQIGQGLLQISENFLNRMNMRALEDQVTFYQSQVEGSIKTLAEMRAALTTWRNKNNALDPLAQATMIQGLISGLETELTQIRADITQLLNTDNPERFTPKVRALQEREASLILQISETRQRLTGESDSTVAVQISAYEELNANVEFAQKNLDIAVSALEAARQRVMQQQKYLLLISSPSLSDQRVFPLPGFHSLVVMAAALLVFGLLVLLHSLIRDYRNV